MSEQKQSSETAQGTAFIRALSCFEPDPKIRGMDDLASLFLPEAQRHKLQHERYRAAAKSMIDNGTYEYVMARTKYFDDILEDSLADNIEQIVILGAGYDTRAYRFSEKMAGIRVFEVDAPYTQTEKIERLETAGIPHDHVRFVSVDFEKDDLMTRLSESGHRKDLRTLFIWEGVSLYLTPESVDSTLDHLRSLCCAGSILCFDYFNCRVHHTQNIRKKDELILFGMSLAEMNEYLSGKGFSVKDNIDESELHRRFLVCGDGSLFGDTKNKMNLVAAYIE